MHCIWPLCISTVSSVFVAAAAADALVRAAVDVDIGGSTLSLFLFLLFLLLIVSLLLLPALLMLLHFDFCSSDCCQCCGRTNEDEKNKEAEKRSLKIRKVRV